MHFYKVDFLILLVKSGKFFLNQLHYLRKIGNTSIFMKVIESLILLYLDSEVSIALRIAIGRLFMKASIKAIKEQFCI